MEHISAGTANNVHMVSAFRCKFEKVPVAAHESADDTVGLKDRESTVHGGYTDVSAYIGDLFGREAFVGMQTENRFNGTSLFCVIFSHFSADDLTNSFKYIAVDVLAASHVSVSICTVDTVPTKSVAGKLSAVIYAFHKAVA